ncbi:aminotransferase class V-fold PLP-dependent enzyme [Umezawaea sp. Da 62-37]|uniref:aminotransferase class V-fold PLP-dependent enzyme n=1 Tax=Umezawaea sp. Da 62-37 TaxID=3075927 RepID=UPI0028F6FA63|nr:aminotransferase class V-fold PLP-dependent enzyme [Umezawaea sp. Da 62-37]WNV84000.1 aminotransferase class V-fold PLP-dependent enzyme [Umezawaea sp. Da 62-37]
MTSRHTDMRPAVRHAGEPSAFLAAYPGYELTRGLDRLRRTEFAYLDEQDHLYLDFAGSGLAATAQHRAHQERVSGVLPGGPSTTAAAVDHARRAVLRHLNASPQEYSVVFTANATAAARLVGERYPFTRHSRLVLTSDNHQSVTALRGFAKAAHTETTVISTQRPDLRVSTSTVIAALGRKRPDRKRGLFAFPAQSGFTGVQHALGWIDIARDRGYDVLLDAAAYLPTNTLDLSMVHPDFVTVSWYKLFGYPTGVGCLVIRREALARLTAAPLEEGVDLHSVPDVEVGLSLLADNGIELTSRRVRYLTGWFLDRLTGLRHGNGAPMARVYGPTTTLARGGTVSFNLLDPEGGVVDLRTVADEAAAAGISLHTGKFGNPGAGANAAELCPRSLRALLKQGTRHVGEPVDVAGLPSDGAIRVSFGAPSTVRDVERFVAFVERHFEDRFVEGGFSGELL